MEKKKLEHRMMTFETTIITGYYFFCALIIWVVVTDVSDTKIQTFHLCMQYKQTMVAYISWRILHAVFIIISLIQKKKLVRVCLEQNKTFELKEENPDGQPVNGCKSCRT